MHTVIHGYKSPQTLQSKSNVHKLMSSNRLQYRPIVRLSIGLLCAETTKSSNPSDHHSDKDIQIVRLTQHRNVFYLSTYLIDLICQKLGLTTV